MGLFVSKIKIALVGLVVLTPILLSARKINRTVQENKLLKTIQEIELIIDDNRLKSNDIEAEITNLEYAVFAAQKVVRLVTLEDDVNTNELLLLKQQLSVLNEEKKQAFAQYQSILIEEYKNRDYKTKLYFLASSKSLGEFVNRLNHLNTLKGFRKTQLIAVQNKQKEIEDRLKIFTSSRAEKKRISEQKVREITRLNSLLRIKHQKFNELNSKNNQLKLELNGNNRKLAQLTNSIQRELEAESVQVPKDEVQLDWPVTKGLLVGRFGVQKHFRERKVKITNNGIDILVSRYEKVIASADGSVKAVLHVPGSNTSVIIDHGGYFSVYSNTQEVQLKKGDQVKKGDFLALIASDENGLSKLHFELWKGSKKVDPELFLKGSLN